ncbi:hypothetical protein SAMN05444166_1705 [Singulisphaera sp. GP187]|nr:hypothetical protein SAMN05444166_1705 [Singulisphaera sp. GP187]
MLCRINTYAHGEQVRPWLIVFNPVPGDRQSVGRANRGNLDRVDVPQLCMQSPDGFMSPAMSHCPNSTTPWGTASESATTMTGSGNVVPTEMSTLRPDLSVSMKALGHNPRT